MDETGILNEGEIFCPVLSDRFYRGILVRKDVVITRSPALHPGDVQLVNAVDVPEDSPLRKLHNCVVFSQKGSRDLPSKLGGGDLDGDLFNIIYDDRLKPKRLAEPADYPRRADVVLNRPVQIDDIADFFITFMRQDQLGRIATTHKILADQRLAGTFDPACLTLAELHSTAVDFSKTGKPVCSLKYDYCVGIADLSRWMFLEYLSIRLTDPTSWLQVPVFILQRVSSFFRLRESIHMARKTMTMMTTAADDLSATTKVSVS